MQITQTFLPLAHQVEYNHVSLFSVHFAFVRHFKDELRQMGDQRVVATGGHITELDVTLSRQQKPPVRLPVS